VLCQSKKIPWTAADFGDADLDQVLSGVAAVDDGRTIEGHNEDEEDENEEDEDRISTRTKQVSAKGRAANKGGGGNKQKQAAAAFKRGTAAPGKQNDAAGVKKAGTSRGADSASGGVPSGTSATTTASCGESQCQPIGSGFRGPLKVAFKHWKAKQGKRAYP
jgi:hypothetical protein